MKNKEELEKRITELEYRLRVIEDFLDRSDILMNKHDESMTNASRINIVNDMKTEGFEVSKVKQILGTRFYRKGE